MKKVFFLFALALGTTVAATAQRAPLTTAPVSNTTAPATNSAQMKFETIDINYGDIMKGGEPNREFIFTNTGNEPLIISNAAGSCGCTVPTWPKEPIMPGAKGSIKVHYDTQRVGQFTKYVTLTTNAAGQETFKLTIHGNVQQEADAVPANSNGGMLAPHN